MSNQNWNPNNGCLTIRFDQTTSPTISQLNGTEAEILGWAQGIGLPVCIGDEFAGDHGGRLPQSLDELDSWGNNKGLRNPSTTAWSCSPSLAAPQSQPSGPGWYQRSDGIIIQGWDDMDSQLRGAGYPGPYDHDGEETAAYERACLCTLTAYVPPPPVVCSSGHYMTINGAKTVDCGWLSQLARHDALKDGGHAKVLAWRFRSSSTPSRIAISVKTPRRSLRG